MVMKIFFLYLDRKFFIGYLQLMIWFIVKEYFMLVQVFIFRELKYFMRLNRVWNVSNWFVKIDFEFKKILIVRLWK